jgi:hypothetical protein
MPLGPEILSNPAVATFQSLVNTPPNPVVHTGGTIFTIDSETIVGINPATGAPTVNVQLEISTDSGTDNPCNSPFPAGCRL